MPEAEPPQAVSAMDAPAAPAAPATAPTDAAPAATPDAAPAPAQPVEQEAREEEGPDDLGRHRRLGPVGRSAALRAEGAGVVDDHVQVVVTLEHLVGGAAHGVEVGHVGHDRRHVLVARGGDDLGPGPLGALCSRAMRASSCSPSTARARA